MCCSGCSPALHGPSVCLLVGMEGAASTSWCPCNSIEMEGSTVVTKYKCSSRWGYLYSYMTTPTQVDIMRIWPPGDRPSTHLSTAAAGFTLPSNRSGAHNRLAIPGRRREDEPPCQADEWLIDHELRSDWKGVRSQQQQWVGEWTLCPPMEGNLYTNAPAYLGDTFGNGRPHRGCAVAPFFF